VPLWKLRAKANPAKKAGSSTGFDPQGRGDVRGGRAVKRHNTQRDRVLRLLEENGGQWVPLPRVLELGIAQYGARILELRRTGHRIENRVEHCNGVVHSWFRLVPSKGQAKLFDAALEARPRTQEHWLEAQPQRSL
jgi:hypothetical protein